MDTYLEKKRERRIRNFQRMLRRAYRVASRWHESPEAHSRWGPATWDEVFARRWKVARRLADNLKHSSHYCCANGRRYHGDPTLQERRHSLAAVEQLIELNAVDDGPGERRPRRKIRKVR